MNPSFLNLAEEKRERIILSSIKEFAENGYEQASTNRIVEESGISKGSLFKYFDTKEELYLYVIKSVLFEYFDEMKNIMHEMPTDIFERFLFLIDKALLYYEDKPEQFQLFMSLLDGGNDQLFEKLMKELVVFANDFYMDIMKGIDLGPLRIDFQQAFTLIKWLLTGIKMDILMGKLEKEELDARDFRDYMLDKSKNAFVMLKTGLLKS